MDLPGLPSVLAAPAAAAPLPGWQGLLALGPAVLLAAAAGFGRGAPAGAGWATARRAAGAALIAAVLGALAFALGGPAANAWLRLDFPGVVLLLLVAFVGGVIVAHSSRALEGDPGQETYRRRLLWTLAAVLLVAIANHLLWLVLAWIAARRALHGLLLHFGQRPAAVLAAHQQWVVGRLADLALLLALLSLWSAFGTLRLDAVLQQAAAPGPLPLAAQCGVLLFVLAALLTCAQLPFHGWLMQVMEAPTPVSALLHAGIVNLGGFVLIRLAPLVAEVPAAGGLLVVAGTFTAVTAALVMQTRISVKLSLAWSTAAQMGFMLVQCGLGLWGLALLHLVAHGLYKAHAFLSAGSTLPPLLASRLVARPPGPSWLLLLAATAVSLGSVALLVQTAQGLGLLPALAPGAAVMLYVLGLAIVPLWQRALGGVCAPSAAWALLLPSLYLLLHAMLDARAGDLPAPPGSAWWIVPAIGFTALFVLQSLIALEPHGRVARALHPWAYGGLFLDEAFRRAVFRLWPPRRATGA